MNAWQRLWQKWTSPLQYGSSIQMDMLRTAVVFIAFVKLAALVPDFAKWYFSDGWMNHATAFDSPASDFRFSVLRWLPGDKFIALDFAVCVASALLILLGYAKRTLSIVLFVALISLDQYNDYICNGADRTLRVILFYLCFAPAGSYWRGPIQIPMWPQQMLRFQLSVIYFSTAFAKMLSAPWMEGYAVRQVLTWTQYEWLPAMPPFLVATILPELLTYGTLVLELFLPIAIWIPRLWKITLLAAISLHFGIAWSLNIPLFNPLMVVFFVICVPTEVLERIRQIGAASLSTAQKPNPA